MIYTMFYLKLSVRPRVNQSTTVFPLDIHKVLLETVFIPTCQPMYYWSRQWAHSPVSAAAARPRFEHRHSGRTGVEKDAEENGWLGTETLKIHDKPTIAPQFLVWRCFFLGRLLIPRWQRPMGQAPFPSASAICQIAERSNLQFALRVSRAKTLAFDLHNLGERKNTIIGKKPHYSGSCTGLHCLLTCWLFSKTNLGTLKATSLDDDAHLVLVVLWAFQP